jgi:hypothetical protein
MMHVYSIHVLQVARKLVDLAANNPENQNFWNIRLQVRSGREAAEAMRHNYTHVIGVRHGVTQT